MKESQVYSALGRTAIQLQETAMSCARWHELAINSVPAILIAKEKWKDSDALLELLRVLKCSPIEATILLREAMEKDLVFASKIDVTYRALPDK